MVRRIFIGQLDSRGTASSRLEVARCESHCAKFDLVSIRLVSLAKMEPISHLVKVAVPNYLAGLPIPDSIGGWFRLGFRDWVALIPPTALLAGFTFMTYRAFCPHGRPVPSVLLNRKIKKESAKVVDTIDVEDITEKVVFCRCWRSENWPYCDGAHGRHNNETGDNVGPIVITKKK